MRRYDDENFYTSGDEFKYFLSQYEELISKESFLKII